MEICYLGMDGGGTRTRALLCDGEGRILHSAEAGPGNLNAVGEAALAATLQALIRDCLQHAGGRTPHSCLSLAGAESPEVRERVHALIHGELNGPTHITSDLDAALEGAFGGTAGILLICGTGSVCQGRRANGEAVRSGGWGYLVDDAGSGSWIGRLAIGRALRQLDNRAPASALRGAILNALQITTPEEITTRLYHPPLQPGQLAALAPLVCELADAGDPAATQILNAAADELAALVHAVADALDPEDRRVCFTGGLLDRDTALRTRLLSRLTAYAIAPAKCPPVAGAVLLARRQHTGAVDPTFQEQVLAGLRPKTAS